MSGGIYGGDEIGGVVFDFGSNSIRAGFAGEDTPKVDLPTNIGVLNLENETMDKDSSVGKKFYIGTNKVRLRWHAIIKAARGTDLESYFPLKYYWDGNLTKRRLY